MGAGGEQGRGQVGPYRLEGELGRGGMGAVYAARHVQTGARVALKQVLVVDEDPDTLARFEVEARALARVRHPQVVQLLEVGRDARGRPWIAMELVEGESLDEVLRRDGPLPAARALELVRPLVAALAHAHERGVVHRDLKPSNVLVRGRDGAPLLTDFGLAKRLDQSQALTQTGEVLGTPGYLAPEQCGVSGGVGPATDVYGLGALLYALLTGQPPCRGATLIDSLRHVIEVAPRPPSELASVPAELDALCLRCLEKAPARRFRDMGELGAALDSLGEEPRRAGASALLVGAALLVALGVGALAAGGPPAEEAARASAAPSPSPSERAAPSATPGAGVPLIQRAERALGRGDFGEACRAASSARAPWLERLQVAQRLAVAAWEGGEAREIDLARGVAERLLRDAPLERRGSALLLQASFEAHEPPEEQDSAQVRQSAEQALDAGLSPGEEALARSILSRVLPAGAEAVANGVAWVRLAPRSEACLALGLALAELQEPGAAVPFLRRALAGELAPAAKGNALLQLGLGELRVGDFEQGLASLRAVCLLIDRGPQVASHLRLLAQAASACGRETEVMVELEPTVKRWADPLSQRSVKLFAAQSVLTTHPPNLEMAGGWLDQRPLAEEFAPLREWRADLELRRKLIMKKTHRERTYTELPALHFALALQDLAAGRVEDGTRRLLRHPQPLNDLRRFVAALASVGRDPPQLFLDRLQELRMDRAFFGRALQISLLFPDDPRFPLQIVSCCTELLDRALYRDPSEPLSQPLAEAWLRLGTRAAEPLLDPRQRDPWRGRAQLASLLHTWSRLLEQEGWRPLLRDLPELEAAATRILTLTEGAPPKPLRLPLLEIRGSAFACLGRFEEARRAVEQAQEQFSSAPQALMLEAEVARHLHDEDAEVQALRAVRDRGGEPWATRARRRLRELGR